MTIDSVIPEESIERAARGMCVRRKTGQCAAICLAQLSWPEPRQPCAELMNVWGQDARAALEASGLFAAGRIAGLEDARDRIQRRIQKVDAIALGSGHKIVSSAECTNIIDRRIAELQREGGE